MERRYRNPAVRTAGWMHEAAWQGEPTASEAAARAREPPPSATRGRREPRSANDEAHRCAHHCPSHITDWGRSEREDLGRSGPRPTRRAILATPGLIEGEGVSQLLAEPEPPNAAAAAAAHREALTPWATEAVSPGFHGRRRVGTGLGSKDSVSQLLVEPETADEAAAAAAAHREALTPWATEVVSASAQGRRKVGAEERHARPAPYAQDDGADDPGSSGTYDLLYEGNERHGRGRRHVSTYSPYSTPDHRGAPIGQVASQSLQAHRQQAQVPPHTPSHNGSSRACANLAAHPQMIGDGPMIDIPVTGISSAGMTAAAVDPPGCSAAAGMANLQLIDASDSDAEDLQRALSQLGSWLRDRGISVSQHFGRYDTCGNGYVSKSDFLRCLRAAGANAHPAVLRALPAKLMVNGGVRHTELAELIGNDDKVTDAIRSVDHVAALPSSMGSRGRGSGVAIVGGTSASASTLWGGCALIDGNPSTGAEAGNAQPHSERERLRLRREAMRRFHSLDLSARELWAMLDISSDGTIGPVELAAGLQRISLVPGSADAAAVAQMLSGGSHLSWSTWSAFLSDGGEELLPAERRRRLTVSRQIESMRGTLARNTPQLKALLLQADQDASGLLPIVAFARVLRQVGVVLSPADYARVALHLDPDRGGRWVRYQNLLEALQH